MSLATILWWSFVSGLALGVIDSLTSSPVWRWLRGG